MTQCGIEELSDYDASTAIRIRISLYKIAQELIYDTPSDPMHYKSVIPVLVQEFQAVCAAIESIENQKLRSYLGSWYNELREQFFMNENVQAFVYNQLYGNRKEDNQAS